MYNVQDYKYNGLTMFWIFSVHLIQYNNHNSLVIYYRAAWNLTFLNNDKIIDVMLTFITWHTSINIKIGSAYVHRYYYIFKNSTSIKKIYIYNIHVHKHLNVKQKCYRHNKPKNIKKRFWILNVYSNYLALKRAKIFLNLYHV